MKKITTGLYVATALVAGLIHAEEFSKESSPQVFSKVYSGIHKIELPHEIGKSTFIVSTDCHDTEAAATAAVNAKIVALQAAVDATIQQLGLGEKNKTLGYGFSENVSTTFNSPVSNQYNDKEKQYFWTNRCTAEKSEQPVRANFVFNATKVVTVWFPNTGKTLNNLTALVKKLESLSDAANDGVKVVCNSNSGGDFDLDVTEETEKTAWETVKEVAQSRANEKMTTDFATTKYDRIWKGPETFSQQQSVALGSPNEVVKINGKWTAKFSTSKDFTVFYKQSSELDAKAGELSDKKTYSVNAETQTQENLYATLVVTVRQDCQEAKALVEQSVNADSENIIAEMRKINNGAQSETDRVEFLNVSSLQHNPTQGYDHYENKNKVRYWYNTCTLETHETTEQPNVNVWRASRKLTIVSSNLDALKDLGSALTKQYTPKNDDQAVVSVTTNWKGTATLARLEKVSAQLESSAYAKFKSPDGQFCRDAGKFSFACLSQTAGSIYNERGFQRGAAAPESYSDDSTAPQETSASERGVKPFIGAYSLEFTVSKLLVDDKRK